MVTMPCSPEDAREFWLDGAFEAKVTRPNRPAPTLDHDAPPLPRPKRSRRPRRITALADFAAGDMVAAVSDPWAA